jgi:hypothetical protein
MEKRAAFVGVTFLFNIKYKHADHVILFDGEG